MSDPLSPDHLHTLQHALGLDQYGQGSSYRNHYVCDEGDSAVDYLCARGYMEDHGPRKACSGMHLYTVTVDGVMCVRRESPKPPELSRSQRRYRKFLAEDSGLPFGEWLAWRHGRTRP